MYFNPQVFVGSFMMALVCSGCAIDLDAPEEKIGETQEAVIQSNDIWLNGTRLNGIRINGIRINGIRINGIRINGVVLTGTQLSGTLESDGTPLSGEDFSNADMTVVLDDSSEAPVRIEAITPSGMQGLNFYTVTYDAGGGNWQSICGAGVDAIPLYGVWDNTTATHANDATKFTFACRGAALAKCVEWGYERWGTASECTSGSQCHDVSLDEVHQACTRMVRADYCGDGVAHTENGTTIDVWDSFGIQEETPDSGLLYEAEWSANGASCIQHTRWADSEGTNPDKDYILAHCPERWAGPENPNPPANCFTSGSDFFTDVGYSVPLSTRRVLRNASAQNLR